MATQALAATRPAATDEWTELFAEIESSLSAEQAARRRLRAMIAKVEAEGERQRRVLAG